MSHVDITGFDLTIDEIVRVSREKAPIAVTPEAVERDLERHIPVQDRAISHHWLILHGRYICTAHRPKCGQCAIKAWCKEGPFEP